MIVSSRSGLIEYSSDLEDHVELAVHVSSCFDLQTGRRHARTALTVRALPSLREAFVHDRSPEVNDIHDPHNRQHFETRCERVQSWELGWSTLCRYIRSVKATRPFHPCPLTRGIRPVVRNFVRVGLILMDIKPTGGFGVIEYPLP